LKLQLNKAVFWLTETVWKF